MNALEARGLGKRFGRTWALQDCTLAIPAGSVTALVGPNGSGKTTLLHIAVGLTTPSAGRAAVLGSNSPGSNAALASTAFVAQNAPLYPHLTVVDTLHLVANLSPRWDDAAARVRLADLAIPLTAKVGRLSGGQRSQVALAVALGRRPQLLVLDEPVASLDPVARHDFMATLMAAVAEYGLTVLFSSHVVAELERVCDRLIVLNHGRVQVAGEAQDLVDSHRVMTGPAIEAAAVASACTVVHENRRGPLTSLLIRTPPVPTPPDRWELEHTNLEELVLAYLRTPEATVLPGPRSTTAEPVTT